ncbi:MAG: transporter substrate-binding domain-containing protein [Oligoflexia bacterium]|nr:transporter substrate-binding domain-containing protein [Oligoflexia bacterium]
MLRTNLFLLLFSFNITAAEIKVSYTPIKPYSYLNDKNEVKGKCPDLAKTLFHDTKFKIRDIYLPWKRTLLNAKKGDVDLIICISKSPDREKYLHFSEPMGHFGYYLVTNKNIPKLNLKDKELIKKLLPYRIVMNSGSNVGDPALQKLVERKNTVFVKSTSVILEMIAKNRGDYAILPKDSIYHFLNDRIGKKLRIYKTPIKKKYVYSAVSKKSKNITVDWLNRKLKNNNLDKSLDFDRP